MKRPERPGPPPPRPAASPRDTKSVLYEAALEAVQDRVQHARSAAERRPPRRRRLPVIPLLLAVAMAGGTLLLLRPVWLAGPRSLPPETPGVAAASLRVVLIRERSLVANFIRQTGRPPASLAEAGSTTAGLDLRIEPGGFAITGRAGDSVITIRSSDSVTVFLGDSFHRLRSRVSP